MSDKIKYYLEILLDDGKFKSDKFLPFIEELETVTDNEYMLVRSSTGEVKAQRIIKYYKQDATPNPNQAGAKDRWLRLNDMRLFEIITAGANQFWAEVTAPKITE